MADVKLLDMLIPEPGSYYVLDRGYIGITRLYDLHVARAFFIIRSKSNIKIKRVYSYSVDRESGVICDQRVVMPAQASANAYPEQLRRIRFKDPESGNTIILLTNDLHSPPLTICTLYKSRWQVELFFKWIKQHLRIKRFYGNSENAVKTQIWIAVSVYVLIAIIKKRLELKSPLYNLLQILSLNNFEKIELRRALSWCDYKFEEPAAANQLNLP